MYNTGNSQVHIDNKIRFGLPICFSVGHENPYFNEHKCHVCLQIIQVAQSRDLFFDHMTGIYSQKISLGMAQPYSDNLIAVNDMTLTTAALGTCEKVGTAAASIIQPKKSTKDIVAYFYNRK